MMAGFPMPIFGVKGMRFAVGIILLWSVSVGRIWVCDGSLRGVPLARGEEHEGEETISASLSTAVLLGFSPKDNPESNALGLLSSVEFISSDLLEVEGLTVSAKFM